MKIPPSFYIGLGRFILFVALECLCFVMISNNSIVQRYKLFSALRNFQMGLWEGQTSIREYTSLKKINNKLAEDNLLLISKLDTLKYAKLDSIAKDSIFLPYKYIRAKVINNVVNTSHNYLIINKGWEDGIKEDMGVITSAGIIGVTRAISKNCSYVLSFLNTQLKISAKVGKDKTIGSLIWDEHTQNKAILLEIPQHIEIMEQDTVYTSGYSSLFPPDIPIGKVLNSKIIDGTHKEISVELFQNFRQLNYVIVVENNLKHEMDSLIKAVN